MKKVIWMGKKKGRKASSKSVRTCGHCMKQQCHHDNCILEFISTFLMYSLFKSSHSISTFHCNFCSAFWGEKGEVEQRKNNWQASQLNVGKGKVCVWLVWWKMQKERKELGQSQRGESSKEGPNKGWIRLCSSGEVALLGFHSWWALSIGN